MTKRFIDCDLFDDEWFCELSKDAKLMWIYLITKCDHAGIFDKSHKLAEFQMSIKSFDTVTKELNGKLMFLEGEKIFIPKFIKFQYPKGLDKSVKPQKSVIDILKGLGVDFKNLDTVTKELHNSYLTVQDKDKDIHSDKNAKKATNNTDERTNVKSNIDSCISIDFDSVWKLYPKKIGKPDAERHFRCSVKNKVAFDNIQKALQNYLTYIENEKVEPKYIKHASAWFHKWQNWVDVPVFTPSTFKCKQCAFECSTKKNPAPATAAGLCFSCFEANRKKVV